MKKQAQTEAMDTIWEVPDELWETIEGMLNRYDPPKDTGRPRVDLRRVLNGILFRLRSGCQWNQLPKQFGDDSTVHRYFQQWNEHGVFEGIWKQVVNACEKLGAVEWTWQAADGALGKARMGGNVIGPNPTDRGKNGIKRSVLVEGKRGR